MSPEYPLTLSRRLSTLSVPVRALELRDFPCCLGCLWMLSETSDVKSEPHFPRLRLLCSAGAYDTMNCDVDEEYEHRRRRHELSEAPRACCCFARRQARPKGKGRPSRGLDLEEVRRRTSLLTGGGQSQPVAASAHDAALGNVNAASRPTVKPHINSEGVVDSRFRRHPFDAPPYPRRPPEPEADPFLTKEGIPYRRNYDERGNYFNEDLLSARNRGRRDLGPGVSGESVGYGDGGRQSPQAGNVWRDSAGRVLVSARCD